MRNSNALRYFGNKIFLPVAVLLICFAGTSATAQTTNWTGFAGDFWTRAGSWSHGVPDTSSIAVIDGGSGTMIALTDGSVNTASVGTLLLRNLTYTSILPGASAATMSFGSSAAMRYAPSSGSSGTFDFGAQSAQSNLVTTILPGMLNLAVQPGFVLNMRTLILGDGSVLIGTVPGQSTAGDVIFGFQQGEEFSTFGGGVTVGADTRLRLGYTFEALSQTHGPLGTGTLTLAGGTLDGIFYGGPKDETWVGNPLLVSADSVVTGRIVFMAPISFGSGGRTLTIDAAIVRFDQCDFNGSATDRILFGNASVDIVSDVGQSLQFDGSIDSGNGTTTLTGTLNKFGTGTFATKRVRVADFMVVEGTYKMLQEGTTVFGGSADTHTSRVNSFTMEANNPSGNPIGKLDLSNNEMIIDYTGTGSFSPLAGTLSSGVGFWIKHAYNNGSWNQNGVTSEHANSGTFAVGYGEASTNYGISGSGTATFEGQTVDATSVLLKATYYGDANLDGTTNLADYARLALNFNGSGLWTEGDSDYDGAVDLADYGLMAANWNGTVVARGLPPLADLYIAMLDHPVIYWESRLNPEFWNRFFAQFENLNLGPVPPMPDNLSARGIPEPVTGVALAIAALGIRRGRSGEF